MKKLVCYLIVASLLCVGVLPAWSQQQLAQTVAPELANSLQSIEVSKSAGATVLQFGLRQALISAPSHFVINNPARLVFDLPDTGNSLGFNSKNINEGNLRSINIVQAGNRSRLVLNLEKNVNFDVHQNANSLIITLSEEALRSATVTADKGEKLERFASGNSGDGQWVRDIQFRRGKEGAGVISVDLSATDSGIDVKQKGSGLFVTFKKTKLPEPLRRRLEVGDFATPVISINTDKSGEDVHMEVVPQGLWEHIAFQSDNQFVIEIKPIKEDPNKLFQGSKIGYQGEAISLNFQNIPLRELLHVFADITNFNIVVSDSVAGNVSLRLNDVPWDHALEIVLQQKNLSMRKSGNVLWIAPRDELAARDKTEAEAREAAMAAEIPRMEVFQLNYQKADDFAALLMASQKQAGTSDKGGKDGGFLSHAGRVTVDKKSNQAFIFDIPSKLDLIRELQNKVDRPPKQVLIEARLVEARTIFSKTLGARLGLGDYGQSGSSILGDSNARFQIGGTLAGNGFYTGASGTYNTNRLNVNLPSTSVGAATSTPGVFSIILFNQSKTNILNLELSALEADRTGKTISSPRVVTADKVEALIEQGTEIPYLQSSSSGAANIAFKKAVLSLKVTPQITPDGRVMMKLNINKDSPSTVPIPGTMGNQIAVDTKKVETEVVVDNGGTVVIGGIYTQQKETNVQRTPFFGDLPYVGFLFKQKTDDDDRRELLVFITPKIVSELSRGI